MQFISNYLSTERGAPETEIYFDPVEYIAYERVYPALWRKWHGTVFDYVDDDDPFEQRREELMVLGQDISSRPARDDAQAVLSLVILPELLSLVDIYHCTLHPKILVPAGRDTLMSWLTECDFSSVTAPEAMGGRKLIHDHTDRCNHFNYGMYVRDGWIYDIEWCDDSHTGGFYEMLRPGYTSRPVPPIVAVCLAPPGQN